MKGRKIKMNKKQKDELYQLSQEGIKSIRHYFKSKKDIKELVDFMGKFYTYSPRNQQLIEKQFPGAFAVESFSFFNEHGFRIKKGEKAIHILAPTEYKVVRLENGQTVSSSKWDDKIKEGIKNGTYSVTTRKTFTFVPVFDVLQTDAKPEDLPKLFPNRPYHYDFSNVHNKEQLMESLIKVAEKHDIPVMLQNNATLGSAKGAMATNMKTDEKSIKLNHRLSDEERIPTMIHELTHALLHDVDSSYQTYEKEFQAEFCSYLICHQFGIDTSEQSFPYIAGWTNNLDKLSDKELMKQLDIIQRTSKYITEEVMTLSQKSLVPKSIETEMEADKETDNQEVVMDYNRQKPSLMNQTQTFNIALDGSTKEQDIQKAKIEPFSSLVFKINQQPYMLVTDRNAGQASLMYRGNSSESIPPYNVIGDEKEEILSQLEMVGYLPMSAQDYKEMEAKISNHLYPTNLDYHFLNAATSEDIEKFNQWNMDYDSTSGLLNTPFISIEWSENPAWHDGMVLSVKEMQKQFNQLALDYNDDGYNKVKLNLHITPNEYYQTKLYLSQNDGSFETQLEREFPKICQELDMHHLLKEVNKNTQLFNTNENWENIQINTVFKEHQFTYDIEISHATQMIKGTYTRDQEAPREATQSACISALKYVIDHNELEPEQQLHLQQVIQDNEERLERQSIYQKNQENLEHRFPQLKLDETNIEKDNQLVDIENNQKPAQQQKATSNWEQALENARTANILEVAQSAGIQLKREGATQYRDANNHSMVFTPSKNSYYENNGQFGGDPIHFVQNVVGIKDFKEAVQYINNTHAHSIDLDTIQKKEPYHYHQERESQDFSRAFDYLTKERGIKPALVNKLHEAGLIRQDKRNNVLFLWNNSGKVVGCTEQGTVKMKEAINGRHYWKGIQRHSESNQGFNFGTGQPKNLKFFESPIDSLSYVSIHGLEKDTRYMSMDGLKEQTVIQTIKKAMEKTNNQLSSIQLCVDNDEAGRKFAQKFNKINQVTSDGQHYDVPIQYNAPQQPEGKEKWDWNNELKHRQQKNVEKKQTRQQGSDLEL